MPSGDFVFASDYTLGSVGRGRRTTPSSNATTAELGVLRVDGVTMKTGRAYRIWTSPLNLKGSVAGDIVEAKIRVNETGTATISSTQFTHIRAYCNNASFTAVTPLTQYYEPSVDTTTASFLLSVFRAVAGTSSTGVQIYGSPTEVIEVVIEDIGLAVADTGVDI
jgi:hypothetical protein